MCRKLSPGTYFEIECFWNRYQEKMVYAILFFTERNLGNEGKSIGI